METPGKHRAPEAIETLDPLALTPDCPYTYLNAYLLNNIYATQADIIATVRPWEHNLELMEMRDLLLQRMPSEPPSLPAEFPTDIASHLSNMYSRMIEGQTNDPARVIEKELLIKRIAHLQSMYDTSEAHIDEVLAIIGNHAKMHYLAQDIAAEYDEKALQEILEQRSLDNNAAAHHSGAVIQDGGLTGGECPDFIPEL